jgi:hypothetical protein
MRSSYHTTLAESLSMTTSRNPTPMQIKLQISPLQLLPRREMSLILISSILRFAFKLSRIPWHRQQDTAQGRIRFTGTWNKKGDARPPTPKSRFFSLAGSPETRSRPLPFVLLFHGGIHSTHGFGPVVSPLLALNLLPFLPPPNFDLTTIQ